jgi:hypothetical protein
MNVPAQPEGARGLDPHGPTGIRVPKLEDHGRSSQATGESKVNYTTVGVDIAKNVMQMHWVDPDTGEIVNKSIKRSAFLEPRTVSDRDGSVRWGAALGPCVDQDGPPSQTDARQVR